MYLLFDTIYNPSNIYYPIPWWFMNWKKFLLFWLYICQSQEPRLKPRRTEGMQRNECCLSRPVYLSFHGRCSQRETLLSVAKKYQSYSSSTVLGAFQCRFPQAGSQGRKAGTLFSGHICVSFAVLHVMFYLKIASSESICLHLSYYLLTPNEGNEWLNQQWFQREGQHSVEDWQQKHLCMVSHGCVILGLRSPATSQEISPRFIGGMLAIIRLLKEKKKQSSMGTQKKYH